MRQILPVATVARLHVFVPMPIGFGDRLLRGRGIHAEALDGDRAAKCLRRDDVDMQRVRPRGEQRLRAPAHEHDPPLARRLGDHALGRLDERVLLGLDRNRMLAGGDEHFG